MNVLLKGREAAFYLGDSQARLLFAAHELAEPAHHRAAQVGAECVVVEPLAFGRLLAESSHYRGVSERARDDTAVVLYTSGTTGKPKGAQLTHANLAINADVSKQLFALGSEDVVLGALPLFHAFWSDV